MSESFAWIIGACFVPGGILFGVAAWCHNRLKSRVYLCGPMTGYPDNNYPLFFKAEEHWKKIGAKVLSPARGAPQGWTWQRYMRRSLAMLLRADMVAVLPGWEKSRGASLEVSIADGLDIPIIEVWTGKKIMR